MNKRWSKTCICCWLFQELGFATGGLKQQMIFLFYLRSENGYCSREVSNAVLSATKPQLFLIPNPEHSRDSQEAGEKLMQELFLP